MSFKGYTSFVKKHMNLRGLGVVTLGLALPSIAGYMSGTSVGSKVMSYVDRVPGMTTNTGRAALAVATTAGVAYLMTQFGVITASEALTANMIALGLVAVGAAKAYTGNAFVAALPSAGGLAGLGGGSYGYIGNYSAGAGVGADMLPQPRDSGMFGVKANVF